MTMVVVVVSIHLEILYEYCPPNIRHSTIPNIQKHYTNNIQINLTLEIQFLRELKLKTEGQISKNWYVNKYCSYDRACQCSAL